MNRLEESNAIWTQSRRWKKGPGLFRSQEKGWRIPLGLHLQSRSKVTGAHEGGLQSKKDLRELSRNSVLHSATLTARRKLKHGYIYIHIHKDTRVYMVCS